MFNLDHQFESIDHVVGFIRKDKVTKYIITSACLGDTMLSYLFPAFAHHAIIGLVINMFWLWEAN